MTDCMSIPLSPIVLQILSEYHRIRGMCYLHVKLVGRHMLIDQIPDGPFYDVGEEVVILLNILNIILL